MSRASTSVGWSTLTLVVASGVAALAGYWTGRPAATASAGEATPTEMQRSSDVKGSSSPAQERSFAESPAESATRGLRSKERDRVLQLERFAEKDPPAALALAQAEKNLWRRAKLREAVLRGWAATAPGAAGEWVLTLPGEDRSAAMAAVFEGAMQHPEEAARWAARACAQDPERAADYGQAVLGALAEAGEFGTAVRFVEESPDTPLRLEEINSAFAQWAQRQPEQAAAALAGLTDPALKASAFRGLAIGWAQADPVSLANYAAQLPAGEGRAQALANALPRWVQEDPVAAAAWIAANDAHPDFDMGVVAVAMRPELLADKPETAMSLALSINDAALRTNTLRTLALKWAETDPTAAARYVETSASFPPEDRTALLGEIRPPRG